MFMYEAALWVARCCGHLNRDTPVKPLLALNNTLRVPTQEGHKPFPKVHDPNPPGETHVSPFPRQYLIKYTL